MKRRATAVIIVAAAAVAAVYALLRLGPWRVGDPLLLLDMIVGRGIASPSATTVAQQLVAASGFEVRMYEGGLPAARWLAMTPAGDLLVAQSRVGNVQILARDANGDGRPDRRRILLDGLDYPHGLAVHDAWLYVAERTAVGRIRFDAATGTTSGSYAHVVTGLTGDGNHVTRTIGFGPDGKLYLSQGSTCNVCEERDHRRATMMRFDPDGSHAEIYATGLRNSVGFDWAPWDGALYATENGRDLLGDDFPPDELNRIELGRFYGWPYVNGYNVLDPDLGRGHEALLAQSRPPVHGFRAHNAPLGIVFLRSPSRPPGYERAAIVALHGSWNRSVPDGYKVVSLHWRDDGSIEERDFLTGFLTSSGVIGRPAGVAEGPDGAVYIADDYAGAIYRVAPVH
ncbi:MAG: PQQ-dependent sugar dehydrogenase [Steroidobacteraceae bacterium]